MNTGVKEKKDIAVEKALEMKDIGLIKIIIFLLGQVDKFEELIAAGINFDEIRKIIYSSNDLDIIQKFYRKIMRKIYSGHFCSDLVQMKNLIKKEKYHYMEAFRNLYNKDYDELLTDFIENELKGPHYSIYYPDYSELDALVIDLIMEKKISGNLVSHYVMESFDFKTKAFQCNIETIEETILQVIIGFYNYFDKYHLFDSTNSDYLKRRTYEEFLFQHGDLESLVHLTKLYDSLRNISNQEIADEFYKRGLTPDIPMLKFLLENDMLLEDKWQDWEEQIYKQCSALELYRFLEFAHIFDRLAEIDIEKYTKVLLTSEEDDDSKVEAIYRSLFLIYGFDFLLLVDELEKMSDQGCQKAQNYFKMFAQNSLLQDLYFEALMEREFNKRELLNSNNPHQDSTSSTSDVTLIKKRRNNK